MGTCPDGGGTARQEKAQGLHSPSLLPVLGRLPSWPPAWGSHVALAVAALWCRAEAAVAALEAASTCGLSVALL